MKTHPVAVVSRSRPNLTAIYWVIVISVVAMLWVADANCVTQECTFDSLKSLILQGFSDHEIDSLALRQADCLAPMMATSFDSASVAFGRKKYDVALGMFTRMLSDTAYQTVPRGQLYFLRGMCFTYKGKYSSAIQDIDSSILSDRSNPVVWCNRSYCLSMSGRLVEALASADSAIALDAKSSRAWKNRGLALEYMKRSREAVSCFDSAIQRQHNLVEAWLDRAMAYGEMGEDDSAIQSIDTALAIAPDIGIAWWVRSGFLISLKRDNTEILMCVDSALAHGYRTAEAWTLRGALLKNAGRYLEAAASFDSSLAIYPFDPKIKAQKKAVLKLLWGGGK